MPIEQLSVICVLISFCKNCFYVSKLTWPYVNIRFFFYTEMNFCWIYDLPLYVNYNLTNLLFFAYHYFYHYKPPVVYFIIIIWIFLVICMIEGCKKCCQQCSIYWHFYVVLDKFVCQLFLHKISNNFLVEVHNSNKFLLF